MLRLFRSGGALHLRALTLSQLLILASGYKVIVVDHLIYELEAMDVFSKTRARICSTDSAYFMCPSTIPPTSRFFHS
jgi:hypothetical protein